MDGSVEIGSIERFYERWFGAMEDGDIEEFLSLLDEEFYLKSPARPPVTDKDALREDLEEFHRSYRETVEWRIEDVRLFDDYATVRLTEKVTLIDKGSDETIELKGVHLALLRKSSGGTWLLHTDVSSFSHPMPG